MSIVVDRGTGSSAGVVRRARRFFDWAEPELNRRQTDSQVVVVSTPSYRGVLYTDADERCLSRVYGFEDLTSGVVGSVDLPDDGAASGFAWPRAVTL